MATQHRPHRWRWLVSRIVSPLLCAAVATFLVACLQSASAEPGWRDWSATRYGRSRPAKHRAPERASSRPIAVDAGGVIVFEATVDAPPLSLEAPRLNEPTARLRELLPERQRAGESAPLLLGDTIHDLGDLDAARGAYLRAVELQPRNPAALGRLAVTDIERGRPGLHRPALERPRKRLRPLPRFPR